MELPDSIPALVVAHPGHEIRIHHWLATTRPAVCILTDGSGRSGQPRLDSTTTYLRDIGGRPGALYGRFLDSEIYRALLDHDFAFFIGLVEELAESFERERVGYVVGDAAEGYNSAHDVCRLLVNSAVERANSSSADRIANYDFPVVDRPDDCPETLRDKAIWLHLDEAAFVRKLAAARKYYPELVAETESALSGSGSSPLQTYLGGQEEAHHAVARETCLDVFRVECLRPVLSQDQCPGLMREKPFYESHGERQVAAGYYAQAIRYREHLAPLAEALREHIERSV